MSPTLHRAVALAVLAGAPLLASAAVRSSAPRPPADAARPAAAPTIVAGEVRDDAGAAVADAQVVAVGTALGARTGADGRFALRADGVARGATLALRATRIGFAPDVRRVRVAGDTVRVAFTLRRAAASLQAVTVGDQSKLVRGSVATEAAAAIMTTSVAAAPMAAPMMRRSPGFVGDASAARRVARGPEAARASHDSGFARHPRDPEAYNREGYDRIEDNPFLAVGGNPRSTFSIDVDRASYGNVRRFLAQGQRPPADAVRIEELVNYFPYALPAPRGEHPIAIATEVMPAPWQPKHQLVRVALQARRIETAQLPPSNLVFLLDVSGSMATPEKLPLVKQAFRLLVEQLRPQDRVAIVVYAGAAGLVLPSTSGREKARILEAIDRLEAGGSTAGGEGLLLAYRTAREARREMERGEGRVNSRVVLATDGDFNVGVSSDAALERLIEEQRASGTYLTVLGFGTGNYQDAKMEKLAKRGNGNYAYVDDIAEARKVLVQELGATLHVVAQDVKLQVEFNPAAVRAYRLLGYENRLLRDEDFADDRKDAGDVGAGHTVTALYEVVPAGVTNTVAVRGAEPLRYGASATDGARATTSARDELLFVQLRYKRPGEDASRLMRHAVHAGDAARAVSAGSADFRFAAAVAGFGMLLRDSEHKGAATGESVLALARGALGDDAGGHRAEFVGLVERWRRVAAPVAAKE
jgi:Ca-activated chloride channel family protein